MKHNNLIIISLVFLFLLSITLRIILPFNEVFSDNKIKFTEVDSYYYMRLADYSNYYYPNVLKFDPYLNFYNTIPKDSTPPPSNSDLAAYKQPFIIDNQESYPILGFTVAYISKFTGVDLDIVGAFIPAILGVLLIIPIFIIGWLLFNKWAGLIGAVFVTVLPGELLARTSLGYLDNHCFEVLFASFILMFMILTFKKHWAWSCGAGIFLGFYNIYWSGSPLMTVIIILWLLIQSLVNHFTKVDIKERDKLAVIGSLILGISLVVYILIDGHRLSYIVLFGMATLIPLILTSLSRMMINSKPINYIASISSIFILFILILFFTQPNLFISFYNNFLGLFNNELSIISGMQLLTFKTAWAYYGMVLWFGLAGIIYYYYVNKFNRPEDIITIIFVVAFTLLSIIWVRFNYYLALILALFTGYICWYLIILVKENKQRLFIMAFIIIAFLFVPNTVQSIKMADYHPYMPSNAWVGALNWLKLIPDTESEVIRKDVTNIIPKYSVVSWIDYGYWIVRESNKAVISSPTGNDSKKVLAQILVTGDEKLMSKYKVRYLVVDKAMVTDKYYSMAKLANSTMGLDGSFVKKLWDEKLSGYEKVWESKEKYFKESEVKIFEVK